MSEGPSGADILIGLFMIFAGLCLSLLGGGCSLMMFSAIGTLQGGAILFLMLSLAVLAGGLGMIWIGFKMMTGRYRDGR